VNVVATTDVYTLNEWIESNVKLISKIYYKEDIERYSYRLRGLIWLFVVYSWPSQ
jgi:hypothetical protein